MAGKQNPYLVAFAVAVFAGLAALIDSYVSAEHQAWLESQQLSAQRRMDAYGAFVDALDNTNTMISKLYALGLMADGVATDLEIQRFEDQAGEWLKGVSHPELHAQVVPHLLSIGMNGSTSVQRICDDMERLLLLRDHEIQWQEYPRDISQDYQRWKVTQQDGMEYGWESRIDGEDRLMVVMFGKMMRLLMQEFRAEMSGA